MQPTYSQNNLIKQKPQKTASRTSLAEADRRHHEAVEYRSYFQQNSEVEMIFPAHKSFKTLISSQETKDD